MNGGAANTPSTTALVIRAVHRVATLAESNTLLFAVWFLKSPHFTPRYCGEQLRVIIQHRFFQHF